MTRKYFVYMLSNYSKSLIYIGFTKDLSRRIVYQGQQKSSRSFSKYKLYKLVYFEIHTDFYSAIVRKKQLKRWKRSWKVELIKDDNPSFKDLKY